MIISNNASEQHLSPPQLTINSQDIPHSTFPPAQLWSCLHVTNSQTLSIGKISFWMLPKQLFLGEMQGEYLTPSAPETGFHIAQC